MEFICSRSSLTQLESEMFIFTVGMTRLCKQPGGERWQRCTALHKEGCSPCFCSGILTFQDIKKNWDCTQRPVGKASGSLGMLFGHRAAHQSSPQHRPLHHTVAGWLWQEKQQQQPGVKPSCRTQRCNPSTQHPFQPGERHFSLWKWSSALI